MDDNDNNIDKNDDDKQEGDEYDENNMFPLLTPSCTNPERRRGGAQRR